jgi:hypothetical protein
VLDYPHQKFKGNKLKMKKGEGIFLQNSNTESDCTLE